MKEIINSIIDTEEQLKLDVDDISEFRKLKIIFNFLYLFPNAKITISSSGNGYHLFANVPSSLAVRRALFDCLGRINYSEKRGGDIIFQWKGICRHYNGKTIWIRKPTCDEDTDLEHILCLPFKLVRNKKLYKVIN